VRPSPAHHLLPSDCKLEHFEVLGFAACCAADGVVVCRCCRRYVLVYVNLYHYHEGVCRRRDFCPSNNLDPEGSQIQCIQRNNAPSRFDCFDMPLAVMAPLRSCVFDLLEL
jgi:hypothetical protein